MTFTPPAKATAYLWRADPIQPGEHGPRFEATNSASAPATIKPVAAIGAGSGRPEELYAPWTLHGTAHATAHRDAYGEPILQLWLPVAYGVTLGVAEVVSNKWFSPAS